MTPIAKYFISTNISLIMVIGSFIGGFLVGKDIDDDTRMSINTHLIRYTNTPRYEKSDVPGNNEIPISIVPESVYNNDEFVCLSRTIYFEAGNQSYYGKVAVGSVVMNRVADERYPNTICGVVKQHKQFSWYSDGKSDKPFEDDAWKDSVRAAKEVLCDCGKASGLFFDDKTVQYYHADYVSPKWAKKMKRVAKIDNHIFYR